MKREELLSHVLQANGPIWFNNGSTRNRCVTGFMSYMICYYTASKPGHTQCMPVDVFAKWAQGVGKIGEKEAASNERAVDELG